MLKQAESVSARDLDGSLHLFTKGVNIVFHSVDGVDRATIQDEGFAEYISNCFPQFSSAFSPKAKKVSVVAPRLKAGVADALARKNRK